MDASYAAIAARHRNDLTKRSEITLTGTSRSWARVTAGRTLVCGTENSGRESWMCPSVSYHGQLFSDLDSKCRPKGDLV